MHLGTKILVNVKVLPEDAVDRGSVLVFSNLSSCVAVIGVLDRKLVGIHLTAYSSLQDRIEAMRRRIDQAVIHRLLIVGFLQYHRASQIRNAVGATVPCETYDLARKGVGPHTIAATFVSANERPQIAFQTGSPTISNPLSTLRSGRSYRATVRIGWPVHNLRAHFREL